MSIDESTNLIFGAVVRARRPGLRQCGTLQTAIGALGLQLGGALEHRTRLASAHRGAIGAGARGRTMLDLELGAVRMESCAQNTFAGQLKGRWTLFVASMATLAGRPIVLRCGALQNGTGTLGACESFVADVGR